MTPFFLLVVASLASITPPHAVPSAASTSVTTPRRPPTITDTYRARYQARGDVYCIRIFADPAPATPYPRPSGDTCQSRAKWAKEGLTIHDPLRDRIATETKS